MRYLASPTTQPRTLSGEMSCFQTVHRQMTVLECSHHLLMTLGLEASAGVNGGVFCSCTQHTQRHFCHCWQGEIQIGEVKTSCLSENHFLDFFNALRFSNSKSLEYWGTLVESWLSFCHSNIVSESSFISMRELVKVAEGSLPMAWSACKCC